ncbi:SHOCT domain-containing protein, partial [Mycobacterium sp. E2462]|uniref:SHOCT domain-containing protein n=1 Tax=Mycobacterium sp. E2462 TaxID=1834133 RepID=UPI000AF3B716
IAASRSDATSRSTSAAGMAGRAMAGTGARGAERVAAAGGGKAAKAATETPPPAPGGPITSIAAELRELASLRDAGIITEAEFVEQKQRLLPH